MFCDAPFFPKDLQTKSEIGDHKKLRTQWGWFYNHTPIAPTALANCASNRGYAAYICLMTWHEALIACLQDRWRVGDGRVSVVNRARCFVRYRGCTTWLFILCIWILVWPCACLCLTVWKQCVYHISENISDCVCFVWLCENCLIERCVCVRERDKEREWEYICVSVCAGVYDRLCENMCMNSCVTICVCVCVCVFVTVEVIFVSYVWKICMTVCV
jgi:hypothetical protein